MDASIRHLIAAAAAGLVLVAPAASADPVSLGSLISSRQPMIAGGARIVFSGFFSGNFDADEIMVSILDRGEGGQGFRLSHAFGDRAVGDATPSDFTLLFSAEGMNGARIMGDRVCMEAAATQTGSYVHLNDGVFADGVNPLGGGDPVIARSLSVRATDGPGVHLVENAHEYGGEGHGALEFSQDGWFFAAAGGSAGANYIERTFVTVSAPLPSAATLGLAGLLALGGARRRTRC